MVIEDKLWLRIIYTSRNSFVQFNIINIVDL